MLNRFEVPRTDKRSILPAMQAETKIHSLRMACNSFDNGPTAIEDVSTLLTVDSLLKKNGKIRSTLEIATVVDTQTCFNRAVHLWWLSYSGKRPFHAAALVSNNVLAFSLNEPAQAAAKTIAKHLFGAAL